MTDTYEITTGAHFLYLDEDNKTWIFSRIVMDHPLNGETLQKAADEMLRAMPFLAVRRDKSEKGDRYVLRKNPVPFVVHASSMADFPRKHGDNGYLLSVSYDDRALLVEISHALTDGFGVTVILQYLVTRYFSLLYESKPEPAEVFNKAYPYDYQDPYSFIRIPDNRYEFRYPEINYFEDREIDGGNIHRYCLQCDDSRIRQIVFEAEGSYSGLITGALGCALMDIKPKMESVVIHSPINMRPLLGCEYTMRNCTYGMRYVFPEKFRKYTFHERLSMLKGMLYIQLSEEYCLNRFADNYTWMKPFRETSTIEDKKRFMRENMMLSPCPTVSLLGNICFGEWDRRIYSVETYLDVIGSAGIIMVAQRFHDRCCLNITSSVRDEGWLEVFCGKLRENQIDYQRII